MLFRSPGVFGASHSSRMGNCTIIGSRSSVISYPSSIESDPICTLFERTRAKRATAKMMLILAAMDFSTTPLCRLHSVPPHVRHLFPQLTSSPLSTCFPTLGMLVISVNTSRQPVVLHRANLACCIPGKHFHTGLREFWGAARDVSRVLK